MNEFRSERFDYVATLGRGGMGIVYEAFDRNRGMRVAIKTLQRLDAASVLRLKHEFRVVRDLSHPNLVNLFELVADHGELLLSMEIVDGTDFISYVRGGLSPPAAKEGCLPSVEEVVDLDRLVSALQQLGRGLTELHDAGVVHHDIKPSNVRVTPEGRVVITDFGISTRLSNAGASRFAPLGTPAFMAPEQIASEDLTPAADWYAVGVMAHLALTGRLPFAGTRERILAEKLTRPPRPVSEFVAGAPEALVALCARLLSRRPARRPSGRDVLALLGDVRPSPPGRSSHSSFVGRTGELTALQAALGEADAGSFRLVEICGPSGIGKSRLVEEFALRLQNRPESFRPRIFSDRCHERESLSFRALDSVLDQISVLLAGLPSEQVAAMLPADTDLVARLFPVLRQVPAIGRTPVVSATDPVILRSRAFAAVAALLERLARSKALIIVIDDIQWADDDSLELIRDLASSTRPSGVLMILIRRVDDGARSAPRSGAVDNRGFDSLTNELSLPRLSFAEQSQLVESLCAPNRAAAIPPHLISQCEGNPMLLTQLVWYANDRLDDSAQIEIDTVEGLIAERLATLPASDRAVVEVLGIARQPLPVPVLSRSCGLELGDLERSLSHLKTTALLRVTASHGERMFELSHDKFASAAVFSLTARRIRRTHERIAKALQGWPRAEPGAIAHHWVAAEAPAHARGYLLTAAKAAAGSLAFDRAAALYQQCLTLSLAPDGTDTVEIRTAMANALEYSGNHMAAAEQFDVLGDAAEGEERTTLQLRSAANRLRAGHIEDGIRQLQRALSAVGVSLPSKGPPAFVHLVSSAIKRRLRRAALSGGNGHQGGSGDSRLPARVEALHTATLTLSTIDVLHGAAAQQLYTAYAEQLGDPRWICRAQALAFAYRGVTGFRDCTEDAREVIASARGLGDDYAVALASLAAGTMAFLRGRYQPAIEHLGGSIAALQSGHLGGVAWELMTARYFRELAQFYSGRLLLFSESVDESLAHCERQRDIYGENLHFCEPAAWRATIADDLVTGRSLVARGLDGWSSQTPYLAHVNAANAKTILALYDGDGPSALASLAETKTLYFRSLRLAVPHMGLMAHVWEGRAYALMGDWRRVETAARRAKRSRHVLGAAYAELLRALAEAGLGKYREATAHALRAVDQFSVLGIAHLDAISRFVVGKLRRSSNGDEAAHRALLWLRGQGVRNPERFVALFAPGI